MKTRKKAVIILGVILIMLSGIICKDASYASRNEEPIMTCFEASEAKLEGSMLSGWVSVDNTFMDKQELNSKLDMIISGLEFDKDRSKKIIEASEGMFKATLTSFKDSVVYTIIIESMRNEDMSEKSYCVFTAKYDVSNYRMMEDKVLAEKTFTEEELPIKLDILMTGSYKGKVTKNQSESIINKLLKSIAAHKVESMEDEEVMSVSSYSSRINNYINSKGRKINLQIAMRYSEYDNKTYLWIGSPIIPFEY